MPVVVVAAAAGIDDMVQGQPRVQEQPHIADQESQVEALAWIHQDTMIGTLLDSSEDGH